MILRVHMLLASLLIASCGTTTGNVGTGTVSQVTFQAAFSSRESTGSPSITICPKHLRFGNGAAIKFPDGEITITPSGTTLGTVTAPHGAFTRVDFELDDDCASGRSFTYTDASGQVRSASRKVTIHFDGMLEFTGDSHQVALDFNDIVTALGAQPAGEVADKVDGSKCGGGSLKK